MGLASQAEMSAVTASQQDLDHVEAIVKGASSSFFWGMRSLPLERRRAIYAVYAFCREVDDIADGDEPLDQRKAGLDVWRAEIDRLYDGAPTNAITRALLTPISAYTLERADFNAVIDGMEMDAEEAIQAPSWDELMVYCDRVACAVGRLCVRIFGQPGDEGRRLADALGTALQLTNILRDVHEDAQRDRVYLPKNILSDHGITDFDPAHVLNHPHLLAAWRTLADRTGEEFERAEQALAQCAPDKVRPARIMMEVYRRKFDRMTARAVERIPKPPKRGSLEHIFQKAEKLLMAARYGFG